MWPNTFNNFRTWGSTTSPEQVIKVRLPNITYSSNGSNTDGEIKICAYEVSDKNGNYENMEFQVVDVTGVLFASTPENKKVLEAKPKKFFRKLSLE